MARIPAFKRIILEDYPEEYRDVVGKLAFSINTFNDDVARALDKNLTINDNLVQNKKTIRVTTVSGVPTTKLVVKTGLPGSCEGTLVIKATNKTTSTNYPTTAPFISFINNSGNITIKHISGLQDNEIYDLIVVFYPV